ncbi:Fic family protein [Microbacterium sp.]|uniref:Fic family protein n=1 Tax=Microbacterium sp. TaxID=51671 RepID=UPI0027365958|nr:Fic family protein [Microbacterium sp.]MDP3951885.1 Fic family protein [Microbacterium sp.]
MTDDALAQAAEAVEPHVDPYTPFPSFEEWLRTPFDSAALDRFIAQVDELKNSADPTTLGEAINIATRWAAVNTGAIEGLFEVDRGFTYSVAASAAMLQGIENAKGQFVANSISDAMRAYDFVLDAATGAHPVTEVWVRELHEIVAASQDTYMVITAVGAQDQALPKGVYKQYPNNPLNLDSSTVHSYAPPADTSSEMARLVAELRTDTFSAAHPVLQAAYAHYAFVCIHPFADGNGRVARALASTFLYRGVGVPLVIFADQKADYLDGLEAADKGSHGQFVRFVGERLIDTIGMVREQVLTAALPDVQVQLDALQPLLSGQGGLAHQEIDAITVRVREAFGAALNKQVAENPLSEPMSASTQGYSGGIPFNNLPSQYRRVPGDGSSVGVQVISAAPATGMQRRDYTSMTRLPGTDAEDFIVVSSLGEIVMSGYLREVHPTISQAFVFRAEAAALRELRAVTAQTAVMAEAALRKAGYL